VEGGADAQGCQSVIVAPVLVQNHTSHSEVRHSGSAREEEACSAGRRRPQVGAVEMILIAAEELSEEK